MYEPTHGFYAAGGRAGRRGDFVTSPEVGPLFGAVVARALDTWWTELGEPELFAVVEHGAGPGTLARSIIRANPRCSEAMAYTMVEISESQRALHPEAPGFSSTQVGPTSVAVGVVLANELLDNLPFGIAEHDGERWREVVVAADDGALVEELGEPVAVAGWSGQSGDRAPLQRRARAWIQATLDSLGSGRVVVFDYAVSAAGLDARNGGWLRTFRQQERGAAVLEDLGSQDVTCDVVIDHLPNADIVEDQTVFLERHGIEKLVDEGRRLWQESATAPDLAAIAGRSRGNESAALCDPAGLGAFKVMHWLK